MIVRKLLLETSIIFFIFLVFWVLFGQNIASSFLIGALIHVLGMLYSSIIMLGSKAISVKGEDADPMYRMLKVATGKAPSWNFNKYLIDSSGKQITHYPSSTKPTDPAFIADIEALLKSE